MMHPERVQGQRDSTGLATPFCQPDRHVDGKHAFVCYFGSLSYRKIGDSDWFERISAAELHRGERKRVGEGWEGALKRMGTGSG
jgi:hypothetical protein